MPGTFRTTLTLGPRVLASYLHFGSQVTAPNVRVPSAALHVIDSDGKHMPGRAGVSQKKGRS